MSLDKWLKPERKKEPEKPKPKLEKKVSDEKQKEPSELKEEILDESQPSSKNWQKYQLTCPKKTCKYQKTKLVGSNSQLKAKDKICPRCKEPLKIKKL